jgi:putative ABC transport system permease protein
VPTFTTDAVPVTRRLLAAKPGRVLAGALGIGSALMLILLLTGLWVGVQDRVTTYEDHTGAQLAVVAPGTESLFADPGRLPADTVGQVAATPGVRWAVGVRTTFSILELHGEKVAAALVGAEPGRPGGPWAIRSGRAPRAPDEVAVDALLADRRGLRLGDRLPVLGDRLRIVGFTDDTAMFMTPLVFLTHDSLTGLLRAPGTTGTVLVGTSHPTEVAARLRAAGLSVRTTAQLHQASLRLATRIFGGPVRLMVGVGFLAGLLIVALVAHTLLAEQRRDLGVLKALGATSGRLRRVAVAETATLTAAGAVAGVVLMLAARVVIAAWRPQFPILVTGATLTESALAAAAMAILAAWLPARRLARLDAAAAFRSQR